MRKLAWFVIIVFATILGIAIACAVSDPFKVAVSSTLNGVGGGILSGLSSAVQRLAGIASANVTNFTIYTCVTLVIGGILWIGVKRLAKKAPKPLKSLIGTRTSVSSAREEPRDIIMTENVTPTATKKKEEVTSPEPVT